MKKVIKSLFTWKPIKVSPLNISKYPKRTKREILLIDKNPFGDKDRDRVPNFFDCKPLNKKKQSYMFRKQIEQDVMSPERIVTTPSGKTLHVNFPTKKELIEDIEFHKAYGKSVPPKWRVKIIGKKDVIKQLEKNPELYSKLKKSGTTVEMKNTFDAIFAEIRPGERSLATYRPGYNAIAIQPILDIESNSPLLTTLKHEVVHTEQDRNKGLNPKSKKYKEYEREAYTKMEEPTERQKAKLAGEKPEALSITNDWDEAKDFAHTLKHAEEITGYDTGVERHIAVKGYKFNPETGGYEEGD